jgi:hypothetical protein
MRATGYPLEVIGAALNREGVSPRRGQRWHASAVRSILLRAISSQQ